MKNVKDDGLNTAGKSRFENLGIHLFLALVAFCCLIPFVLVLIVSLSSETAVSLNGYSFFPEEWSLDAYKYIFTNPTTVVRGYGVTIFVTLVGTITSLFLGSMIAYTMSKKDYPYRKALNFYVFFTMLINAGLVPTYMVYTSLFHIKNTIWALLLPGMLLSAWNIIIMRTYFTTSIPDALTESAYLDGAGEFTTFFKIVLPLSKPILGAVGFMVALAYWNNWYNSMVYISNKELYSLQYIMTKTLLDIQSLKSMTELTSEMKEALGAMPTETIRMAMAVVGAGPMLVAFPFFQKYFVKGITVGSVKG